MYDKTKRRGSQRDTSIKRCSITQKIFVKFKRCTMKLTEMKKRKWLQLKDEKADERWNGFGDKAWGLNDYWQDGGSIREKHARCTDLAS